MMHAWLRCWLRSKMHDESSWFKEAFDPASLFQQGTSNIKVVQHLLPRHASTSVPGQKKNSLCQKSWAMSGSKACWVNILVERQVVQTHLRHRNRALARAHANVYTPARLIVPILAATCTIRLHVLRAYTCTMYTCWQPRVPHLYICAHMWFM